MDGVLFRGDQIVVPEELSQRVIDLGHEGHMGMSATKRRMRVEYWWPGLDRDVERSIHECAECFRSDKSQ